MPLIWWAVQHLPKIDVSPHVEVSEHNLPMARQAARLRTAHIEDIYNRGYLRVATRISPTIYVPDAHYPHGIEYDLVQGFADRLGVGVQYILAESAADAYELVRRGLADFAAAGLTINEKRLKHFRYGPSYMTVSRQLIYHHNAARPSNLQDINTDFLSVSHGSSHSDWLDDLNNELENVVIQTQVDFDGLDVIDMVNQAEVDYAIVYSHEALIGRHIADNIDVAFQLGPSVEFAWVFSNRRDHSLLAEVEHYFADIRQSRVLDDLLDRYYAQFESLDRDLALAFLRDAERRIQPFLKHFQEAGEKYGIDWRLLAAMGYQESKWQPDAISHMGAYGLMQITLPTARELGLENPKNPRANIFSAAKYVDYLRNHVAAGVSEPDRTYLAIAAYNVGMGHLADARALTQRKGGNPDRWRDVRQYLPLLSEPEYYREARYGYARGEETVRYVENIRAFHDLMIWIEQRELRRQQPSPLLIQANGNGTLVTTY
ncbi:MAG TPA: membrane-bound lytic murein transglycosylase MltF [Halothiobacillus sp.]|nr:membrane-bound lytic murein transglycosylase MltF [Halothiobacillus sp.]